MTEIEAVTLLARNQSPLIDSVHHFSFQCFQQLGGVYFSLKANPMQGKQLIRAQFVHIQVYHTLQRDGFLAHAEIFI